MYVTITKTKLQLIAEEILHEEQYSFLKSRLKCNLHYKTSIRKDEGICE